MKLPVVRFVNSHERVRKRPVPGFGNAGKHVHSAIAAGAVFPACFGDKPLVAISKIVKLIVNEKCQVSLGRATSVGICESRKHVPNSSAS